MKKYICIIFFVITSVLTTACTHKTEDEVAKEFLTTLLEGNALSAFNMTEFALNPEDKASVNMKDYLTSIGDEIKNIEDNKSLLKSVSILKIKDKINKKYDKVIVVECLFTNLNKIKIEVFLVNLYGKWYVHNMNIL